MRRRLLSLVLASALSSLVFAFVAREALAVSTRVFDVDDAATFALGELHHAAIRSDGRVVPSFGLARTDLPTDAGVVLCDVTVADAVFLGTSTGVILRVQRGQVSTFATTGQMMVASLATDGTNLYAGTLPEGRIFVVPAAGATGAAREWVRLGGALPTPTSGGREVTAATSEAWSVEAVWDLAWDAPRSRLIAATGPEGHLYAIDARGQAQLLFDARQSHAMSVAVAADGSVYAGMSDDAVLLHVTGPQRAEVAWDFAGTEVTDLVVVGASLYAAVNELAEGPTPSAPGTKRSPTSARAARGRVGKGRVYRLGADARVERLWASEEVHVMRLRAGPDESVYAGLAAEGRVVRVDPDRTSRVVVDVDEREILAFQLEGSQRFLATGDGGAYYAVTDRADDPHWTSKVLDAEFAARWGQLVARGTGELRIETRSGNTERPDDTWTSWSTALRAEGPVRSPGARFLQLRVHLGDGATLRSVSVHYLPQNQRPVLTEVGLKTRPARREEPATPSPQLGLTWKVDNTDGDRLRYRLRYREASQEPFRELTRETETLTATEYTWNTQGLPDGHYVVEVSVSDELSNPDSHVLTSRIESEPILIDNHPPELELSTRGEVLRAQLRDALGPIARIEVSVDGRDARPFFPEDDLLDTAQETLVVPFAQLRLDGRPLAPGAHVVAVRGFDAAGNSSTVEANITIGPAARRAP